jgi:hypothetical protein
VRVFARDVVRRHPRLLPAGLVAVAVAVPVLTLPSLPHLAWGPALLGLLPWIVGKYLLCPLRWYALSESGRSRAWHIRAYAEAELCGLLTPGHVGADAWRVKRLTGTACARLTPSPKPASTGWSALWASRRSWRSPRPRCPLGCC